VVSPTNDTNLMFKSTDGGGSNMEQTPTPATHRFPGPGVTSVWFTFFAQIFSANGGLLAGMRAGVRPACDQQFRSTWFYDQHGTGSDPADVLFTIRSTDGGVDLLVRRSS